MTRWYPPSFFPRRYAVLPSVLRLHPVALQFSAALMYFFTIPTSTWHIRRAVHLHTTRSGSNFSVPQVDFTK